MTATAPDQTPYPRAAYAWAVVGLLFCTAVLSYTDRQVLSLLVDPVRADLHVGDSQMGLLLGLAFALIYGIAGVPLGWFADRTSRRNLILAGVGIWSLGTLACGLANSFGQLFAARIAVGLGEAVLSPAAISLISDYFPPRRRGLAVGVYFTGIAIGVGISISIGGAVLELVKQGVFATGPLAHLPAWRVVFLVIGAPGLIWALVLLAIREPARRLAELQAGAPPQAEPVFDRRALLAIAPVYAAVAIASLVDNGMFGWSPSLLIRSFRLDPASVGVQLGLLITLGYGGGMLLGGYLADRAAAIRGRRGKVELCLAAAALIPPTALLMNAPAAVLVMGGVTLYAALSAVVTASGLSAILDASPNRIRGAAMGVSFFLNVAVGAGLGPNAVTTAGGALFGGTVHLGPPLAFTAAVAFALAALALIASLKMLSGEGGAPAPERP